MRVTTMVTVVDIAEMIVDIGTTTTGTEMEDMNGSIVTMAIMTGDMAAMKNMIVDTMTMGMTNLRN